MSVQKLRKENQNLKRLLSCISDPIDENQYGVDVQIDRSEWEEIKKIKQELNGVNTGKTAIDKQKDKIVQKLLSKCKKAGYKYVCIHTTHPKLKHSQDFPFGPSDSIFAGPISVKTKEDIGCPLWDIVEELGIFAGCGNFQQAAINFECEPQAWSLRAGKWVRLDDPWGFSKKK